MTKPEADADDLLYLFYPDTDAARAAGYDHLAKVSTRLAAGGPAVSEEAAMGQFAAIGQGPVGSVRHGAIQPGSHQAARPVRQWRA